MYPERESYAVSEQPPQRKRDAKRAMKHEASKRSHAKGTKERYERQRALKKAAADMRTTCDSSNMMSDLPASSIGGSAISR